MSQAQKEPSGPFNPFYGCAILLIAIITFGGIVTWVLYSGYRQDKEIGQFTVENAQPLTAPAATAEQKTALLTKLDSFDDASANGKSVPLLLSVEELNTLLVISAEKGIADYQTIIRFTSIDPKNQYLVADLCWPMNRLPFVEGPQRFLVGQGSFKPVIENKALELHIDSVTVPDKVVSEGFVRNLRAWPWLNLAKLKPEVKAGLEKVTSFEFSPDGSGIILHSGSAVASPAPATKATTP
ncbi:MAG: hypothetical protein ACAI34_15300 [Verrucomicrobium sp.]|nr:hypothetical protein [Verrucomicrobium sp.]